MEVSTKETLVGTASRVFEQAAFMFADEVETIDTDLHLGVSLKFTGENSGTVELWTVKELALTIADNLLGEIDALSEEKLQARLIDALKEMLNMIAGNLITDLFGTAPVYNLEIPEVIPAPVILQEIPENAAKLHVEGFPVVLLVHLQKQND
jgi:chemotaxis protein CheY-P-specific phosphatase CheC